jgi:hypothetical protein
MKQGKRVYSGGRKWKPGASDKGLEAAIGAENAKKITETPPAPVKGAAKKEASGETAGGKSSSGSGSG